MPFAIYSNIYMNFNTASMNKYTYKTLIAVILGSIKHHKFIHKNLIMHLISKNSKSYIIFFNHKRFIYMSVNIKNKKAAHILL